MAGAFGLPPFLLKETRLKQIETPQAFVYMAKVPAVKTVKGIVFKHGVPVSVHDPKVIRLLARLPYMKPGANAEKPAAKPVKAKASDPLDIPADWNKQHHKRRKAWAGAITGAVVTELGEADRIIAEHLGTAPAPAETQPQAEA